MLFWFAKFKEQLKTHILLLISGGGEGFSPHSTSESGERDKLEMCLMILPEKFKDI